MNNRSMLDIELHKKHEMVEVIDSDEEEEQKEMPKIPDLETILFDRDTELEVEEILESLSIRLDLEKQLKWQRESLEERIEKVYNHNQEMDEELKEIERKSAKMYNELYSLNKPEVKRRPSIEIKHEFEPKPTDTKPTRFNLAPGTTILSTTKTFTTPQKPLVQPKLGFSIGQSTVSMSFLQKAAPQLTAKLIEQPKPQPKIVIRPSDVQNGNIVQQLAETPRDRVYYAVRSKVEGRMQHWAPCRLLEVLRPNLSPKVYRVQFFDNLPNNTMVVRGKEFALSAVNTKLTIGARVIAQFPRGNTKNKEANKKYLPGVIGEKLSKYNRHRYLVFCDYGQVHYSTADCVREVAESSQNVWEDVHENLRQFIKDYLQNQSSVRQRALLNARRNQNVQTEKNGTWNQAIVTDIDCSVIKMYFMNDGSHEWLYRGSKRFGPIYTLTTRGLQNNTRRVYNDPNITYTTVDDDEDQPAAKLAEPSSATPANQAEARVNKNNVAKKSTAQVPAKPAQQPSQALQPAGPLGKVVYLNDLQNYLFEPQVVLKHRHFTPRKDIAAKRYETHKCSPLCLVRSTSNLMNYSPLTKPLLTCWERQIVRQKANRWILYKAPCGRRLRNMHEIRSYLLLTRCDLNVDHFDFDTQIQVLSQYDVPDKSICPLYLPDLSGGKEGMKIPVINPFDKQAPPALDYSSKRIPMPNVHINDDPEFMACCDCIDDCADKTKCACFQMTIRGFQFAYSEDGWNDVDVSYVWKRLLHQVSTGVYECNSRCKCSSRCLNKVVQQPIQIKMHLIRTANRGKATFMQPINSLKCFLF